ncbi:MAG: hypothetical protein PHI55_05615 [Burkholderiaceae bacterium]|nr:hypothetical protein [Burkholderiaceae bacterium]
MSFPSPPQAVPRITLAVVLLLTGCEIPGVWPDPRIAQREEESKAIGGACRHALRGIEDCYALNPKASKAAVFAGWKDMDSYMRENHIEGAPSLVQGKVDKPVKPAADKKTEGKGA